MGIHHRTGKDVQSKIGSLQCGYNAARDWRENTGAGILANGASEETVRGKSGGGAGHLPCLVSPLNS